jgi:enoyl-CoA hydratase
MTYEAIILERDAHIATIRLNRPEKHNAISLQMSQELHDGLDALESDDDVRVIILTGVGDRAFCAGADMTQAVEMMARGEEKRDHAALANFRVLRVKKPIIAAVNGYAYGGGALMAINCDIRICADNARFRFVGASYGLVVGGSQLPRIIGAPLAKELLFTARTIDADEALRIGLANHVVPNDDLESTVLEMAREIAAHSPSAVLASKEVIDIASSVKDAARSELAHNIQLRQSDEHRDRFRAATDRVTKRS